nr:hypothetical protein [Oscillospiraceae bacterium]
MNEKIKHITYRCPECGIATVGIFEGVTKVSDLLRLRCECSGSSLDIKREKEEKLRLSVPCLYCKSSHGYLISSDIAKRERATTLSCPFSGMDIAFIGSEAELGVELERTADELNSLMKALEAEELSDIQPQDMTEAELLPDPAVYDTLRFVLKDLEAEGGVKCPCGDGSYDLRFIEGGIQAYCEKCGASYNFRATTPTLAEEYLNIDGIELR